MVSSLINSIFDKRVFSHFQSDIMNRCRTIYVYLTIALSLVHAIPEDWTFFKQTYKKAYEDPKEDGIRMRRFLENKRLVAEHNKNYEAGSVTFKMSINRFSDMSYNELRKMKNKHETINVQKRFAGPEFITNNSMELPDTVDWRDKGAVTEVKTQGACGACWAFSATGALEAHHFLRTGELISLSEQNLIDCSQAFGNKGCDGGLYDFAFQYVIASGGVDPEQSYPYEIRDGTCRFNRSAAAARAKGYVDLPPGDEEALRAAVATVGPVSVAIDTDPMSLYLYSGGVYYEERCSSTKTDHGALLVGYGTAEDGQDYWLVKNSWGPDWGEEGFFRIARNRDNHCGIASKPAYPIME